MARTLIIVDFKQEYMNSEKTRGRLHSEFKRSRSHSSLQTLYSGASHNERNPFQDGVRYAGHRFPYVTMGIILIRFRTPIG